MVWRYGDRMMFIPEVGRYLTVMLPGELMRAQVTKVVGRNLVFVQLGQPMTRGHTFRLGDQVACRRTPGVLGETWQAIENRPNASIEPPEERKPDADLAEKPLPKAKKRVAKVPGKLKAKQDALDSKDVRVAAQPRTEPRTVRPRGTDRQRRAETIGR